MTVPRGGRSQGCHGYLLPHARALPGSTNLVGTSAQARLLAMSLIFGELRLNVLHFFF